MVRRFSVFITGLLVVCLAAQATAHTTVFLAEIALIGSTPAAKKFKSQDWAQNLTDTELSPVGVRQAFNFGKALSAKFPAIFNPPPKRDEMFLRSVDTPAAIQAATARTIGLWDSFPYVTIDFNREDPKVRPPWVSFDLQTLRFSTPLPSGFAPFPLYTVDKSEEYSLLAYQNSTCPRGYKNFTKLWSSLSDSVASSAQFKSLLSAVETSLSLPASPPSLNRCLELFSYIRSQVQNTKQISEHLESLRSCQVLYGAVASLDKQLGRTAGALWTESLGRQLTAVVAGTNKQKYAHYTTDDDRVLAGLLNAVGLIDGACVLESVKAGKAVAGCGLYPVPGSSVLFELFKDTDGKYQVSMFFDMQQLFPCPGELSCSIDNFLKLLTSKFDSELCDESSKGLKPSNESGKKLSSTWRLLGIICLSLFILQLVLIIYCCCHKLSSKMPEEENLDASEYIEVEDVVTKDYDRSNKDD